MPLAVRRLLVSCLLATVSTTGVAVHPAHAQSGQPPTLRIVVIEGEDAVNIIQQKTAVAPLVEVRDRNNLPVPGATVTFTIGGGQGASFAGANTVTVTTNAAGQATATGFTPTSAGTLRINASASFQGQTVAATITQTNVVTAAQAAAVGATTGGAAAGGTVAGGAAVAGGAVAGGAVAGGAAAGGVAAGGAAAGGVVAGTAAAGAGAVAAGGGIPLLAVLGGAGAAAAVTGAVLASGGGDEQTGGAPGEDIGETERQYAGDFSGPFVMNQGGSPGCTRSGTNSGSLRIRIDRVTGAANANMIGTRVATGNTCGAGQPAGASEPWGMSLTPATNAGGALSFTFTNQNPIPPSANGTGGGTSTSEFRFTGTLSGDVISGTLSYSVREERAGFPPGSGAATFAVTLR